MEYQKTVNSILTHLENAQWWPPDVIRKHQFELLMPLVAHAYRTVPWYRRRFDQLRLVADAVAAESVWHTVPMLTRTDIQDAGDDLHSTEVPADHGRVSTQWTGGSTGTPVMVLTTEVTRRFWIANTLREYRWQGCDLSKKLAVIRFRTDAEANPPNGARLSTWGTATVGRVETGPCAVLSVKSTTKEQADWLRREQPAYLQTYPSLVFELAQHFHAHGETLASLSQIYTYGEVIEPKVREACRRAWDVEILDSYSANEVGHIAVQCAEGGSYHHQAEHLLVEILDENGRACTPGETGRVVITDLFNYAMPLLRYEIGDYADVGRQCTCARNLPTMRKILGRQRNMFVRPNGDTYWPALNINPLAAFGGRIPVRQFQVVQRNLEEIEARLVVTRPLTPTEEATIRAIVKEAVGDGFSVQFAYVDQIPRGKTGKFEDFRCEISQEV